MPPICKHDSFSEKSYFDIKGKGKGSYCKEHKLEGMVYIKGKRCTKDRLKIDVVQLVLLMISHLVK